MEEDRIGERVEEGMGKVESVTRWDEGRTSKVDKGTGDNEGVGDG